MLRPRSSARARLLGLLVVAAWLAPTAVLAADRILFAGDSWAHLMRVHRSLDTVLADGGIGGVTSIGERTTIPGSTAAQWNTEDYLAKLDAELSAHPSVDVVHLSLGFNDVMFRAETLMRSPPDVRDAAIDEVVNDIRAVVDHVLGQRPSVHVVVASYDYVNAIEKTTWSRDKAWRSQIACNWVLGELEARKSALAEEDPRIHVMPSLGVMQVLFGDPNRGIPPQVAPWPNGYVGFPSPAAAMEDALHLNATGYYWLAWYDAMVFYGGYFRGSR